MLELGVGFGCGAGGIGLCSRGGGGGLGLGDGMRGCRELSRGDGDGEAALVTRVLFDLVYLL